MRRLARGCVALLAVALTGCPYDSESPVAEASKQPLDARLLGQFRCVGDGETAATLTISRISATEFEATLSAKGEEETMRFRLASARIGSTPVVNVHSEDPKEKRPWTLARTTLLRPSVLHVELAREEPLKDAKDVRKALAASLKKGDLFADLYACLRPDTADPFK